MGRMVDRNDTMRISTYALIKGLGVEKML